MTAVAQVVAKAEMLIRRPIAEVFEAFVDPAITARFWFSRGDARLEAGKRLRWHWDMYGVSQEIEVKDLQTNRRILIEWPNGDSNPSQVEWLFEVLPGAGTFVSIRNSGFVGTPEEVIAGGRCHRRFHPGAGRAQGLPGARHRLEPGSRPLSPRARWLSIA